MVRGGNIPIMLDMYMSSADTHMPLKHTVPRFQKEKEIEKHLHDKLR